MTVSVTGRMLIPTPPAPSVGDESLHTLKSNGFSPTIGGNPRLTVPPLTGVGHANTRASTAPEYQLEFRISDSGIGITQAQLTRLFRSFSQVQHMSGEYGGTGLGLVISKRLIEAFGGEIHVDSTPSIGSTFTFSICCDICHDILISPPPPTRSLRAGSGSPDELRPHRRVSDSQASPPVSAAEDIHHIGPMESRVLKNAHIWLVGDRSWVIDGYVRLFPLYSVQVRVFANVEAVKLAIEAGMASLASADTAAAASRPDDLLLCDLDSTNMSEEALLEYFQPFELFRLLLPHSKSVQHLLSNVRHNASSAAASASTVDANTSTGRNAPAAAAAVSVTSTDSNSQLPAQWIIPQASPRWCASAVGVLQCISFTSCQRA